MPVASEEAAIHDGIVAEQQRADHPFARVEQTIDDRRAPILCFEPVHARARGRGQRRLASREEEGQQSRTAARASQS